MYYFKLRALLSWYITIPMLLIFTSGMAQVPAVTGYSKGLQSICVGSSGSITVYANNGPTSYQWQYATTYNGSYANLTNGAVYSGVNTNTLNINPNNSTRLYLYFRCIPSNAAGTGTSLYWSTVEMPVVPPPPPVIKSNVAAGLLALDPLTTVCQGVPASIGYRASPYNQTTGTFWSYSGTGVSYNWYDTAFILHFTNESTSGVLSVKQTNGCGLGDAGTLNITVNQTPQTTLAGVPGMGTTCTYNDFYNSGNDNGIYFDNNCQSVAIVKPTGANPVSGNALTSCVTVLSSVPTYNGLPYVQRYYNLDLDVYTYYPETKTATVTLYYTQSDFDNYNAARGSLPALPTDASDATGISNLRVTQYHGTGTVPGTFAGTSGEIDPDDNLIVWNNTLQRWEVTFDITGFSGFFISTGHLAALPLKLISFTGSASSKGNVLNWQTSAEVNVKRFDIMRSSDGNSFSKLAVKDAFNNNALLNDYSFIDNSPDFNQQTTWFYKLKMVDIDGSFSYSNTIKVYPDFNISSATILPNPVHKYLTVNINAVTQETVVLSVADLNGKTAMQQSAKVNKGTNLLTIDASRLANGIYFLHISNNKEKHVLKIVKQ